MSCELQVRRHRQKSPEIQNLDGQNACILCTATRDLAVAGRADISTIKGSWVSDPLLWCFQWPFWGSPEDNEAPLRPVALDRLGLIGFRCVAL